MSKKKPDSLLDELQVAAKASLDAPSWKQGGINLTKAQYETFAATHNLIPAKKIPKRKMKRVSIRLHNNVHTYQGALNGFWKQIDALKNEIQQELNKGLIDPVIEAAAYSSWYGENIWSLFLHGRRPMTDQEILVEKEADKQKIAQEKAQYEYLKKKFGAKKKEKI
jgi:hypothetical protein